MIYWFSEDISNWIREHSALPPYFSRTHVPVFFEKRDCETILGLAVHYGVVPSRNLSCYAHAIDFEYADEGSVENMLLAISRMTGNVRVPFLLGRSFELCQFLLSHPELPKSKAKSFAEMQLMQIGWIGAEAFSSLDETGKAFLDCSAEHEYFKWTISEQDRKSTLLSLQLQS